MLPLISLAEPWGTTQDVTTATTVLTPTTKIQNVTVYNSGDTVIAVNVNMSTNAFYTAFTNNTVPRVLSKQILTLEYKTYSPGSAQLQLITSVLVRAASGTNHVAISGY